MRNKILIFLLFPVLFNLNAFGQTGGNFTITQSVISSGGNQQTPGGIFSLDGTTGQSVGGNGSAGGVFSISSGFWLSQFAPTAAAVSIGGRVVTVQSNGIRNVTVTLTDANGTSRTARTGKFGLFRFDNAATGGLYIISVYAKHYRFDQPTRVLTVLEEITDLEFIASDRQPGLEDQLTDVTQN